MNEEVRLSAPMSMSEVEPYIRQAITDGGCVRVRVKGNSMWPFLVNGRDTVFFEALPKRALRSGDILLYQRRNGRYVMHRLYAVEGDTFTFVGDNQNQLEKGIEKNQLIACVNHCIRNEKDLYCNRSIWNLFMILYMHMRIRLPRTTQFLQRVAVKLKHIGEKRA